MSSRINTEVGLDNKDQDDVFSSNDQFKVREVRQSFMVNALLVVVSRLLVELFLIISLNDVVIADVYKVLFYPPMIATYIALLFFDYARTTSPLNTILLSVNTLAFDGFFHQNYEAIEYFEAYALILVTNALLLIVLARLNLIDIKNLGASLLTISIALIAADTFITSLAFHYGGVNHENLTIAIAILSILILFSSLLFVCLLKFVVVKGWCKPEDSVAAAIYCGNMFIFLIALYQKRRR